MPITSKTSTKGNIVIWIRDTSEVLRSRSLQREVAYTKQRLTRTVLWSWRSASRKQRNVGPWSCIENETLLCPDFRESVWFTRLQLWSDPHSPSSHTLLTYSWTCCNTPVVSLFSTWPMVAYPALVWFSVRNVSLLR